jgi:phosphoribosyl-ATP pyrophosphohydrolase
MKTDTESLGTAIDVLIATIAERRAASPDASYTSSLISQGPARAARKFGEEAIETVIAALEGTETELAKEAADVIFHLLALLASKDVSPQRVADELKSRRTQSGQQEKASRGK